MSERATCILCDGTGKLVLMRSWFSADGYKRCRCAICNGSGKSAYRPDRGYVKARADFRAAFAKSEASHV